MDGDMELTFIEDLKNIDTESIKVINVFDFDNTLFCTPLPNPRLWSHPSLSVLKYADYLTGGGWFHDPRILGATGKGEEVETKAAYEGFWVDSTVEKVLESEKDKNAVTILLTGRNYKFGKLIGNIILSKGLKFDTVILKGGNSCNMDTKEYKTKVIHNLIEYFYKADKIIIYEDRPKHALYFETDLNKTYPKDGARKIDIEVVYVIGYTNTMKSEDELKLVQKIINLHNKQCLENSKYEVSSDILYTGFMLSDSARDTLLTSAHTWGWLYANHMWDLFAEGFIVHWGGIDQCEYCINIKQGDKFIFQLESIAKSEKAVALKAVCLSNNSLLTKNKWAMILAINKTNGGTTHDVRDLSTFEPLSNEQQIELEASFGVKKQFQIDNICKNN